ncbi:hypothetical protein DRO69_09245 [Candidatus Bathyarchaeota archaeon]|nr:MAG: hypothetical protein DRO69_09245 [Candidatus Bathyarchaeota archaeon]
MITALNKVVHAVTAGSPKISDLRAAQIQVYFKTPKMFWVTKPVIVRNVPITAERPTARLAEWRYLFATEGAPKWRGAKGRGTLKQDSRSGKHKAGDTVLAVQAKAQEVLKSLAPRLTKPRADTYDAEAKRYRSYIKYRIHTPEELKAIAGI